MTKVKTIRVLLTLCLLLVALPGAPAQRRKAARVSPDYFPLRSGDSWTYQHSEGSQITIKVLSDEKQADGTVRYLVEASSGTLIHYSYSKPRGWVLLHRMVYPQEENLKIDYQPAKQYLKNPLVARDKWRWAGKDVSGNAVSESSEVIGPEWVEVPAGRFLAMKIVSQVSNGGAATTKTYWYADHVGLVKSLTEAGEIKYGFELTDYSFKKSAPK